MTRRVTGARVILNISEKLRIYTSFVLTAMVKRNSSCIPEPRNANLPLPFPGVIGPPMKFAYDAACNPIRGDVFSFKLCANLTDEQRQTFEDDITPKMEFKTGALISLHARKSSSISGVFYVNERIIFVHHTIIVTT